MMRLLCAVRKVGTEQRPLVRVSTMHASAVTADGQYALRSTQACSSDQFEGIVTPEDLGDVKVWPFLHCLQN
jgi:hypothetical protein